MGLSESSRKIKSWQGIPIEQLSRDDLIHAFEAINSAYRRLVERRVYPPIILTDDAQEKVDLVRGELKQFTKIFWKFYWRRG